MRRGGNMNDKNTKKLFDDFPEFFKHKENIQESLMAFGFECGDGWFDLIYKLCSDIKKMYNCVIPKDFYVVQVKEKFGGLRFYVTFASEEVHDLIHVAENESMYICEHCGKKGEYFYRDKLPWILTLCNDCLKKRIKDRNLDEGDYISSWQKKNKAPFKIIKVGE